MSARRHVVGRALPEGSTDRCRQHLRRGTATFATLAVLTGPGAPGPLAAQTDDSADTGPNIVVFLSDDMGWGQPGFNGGTEVTTPSMDRIANEGVKLTQFYVQPVCSATRGSLLTGRYPWKNGTEARVGLRESTGMLTDERTIAEALRDAGYATWIVGKWHLGQWQQKHLPLQRGFDHHYGHYSGEIHSFSHHRGRKHRGILDWHRNERPVVETGYSTFLLADEAIALIERHDGSSPFFLYLPFNAVHNPNQAPDEYLERYEDLDDHEQRAQLKAMDDAIGQVLAALERKGVLDDTLIMFLNDNGGSASAGWNEPYRGKKSGFLEGGIRMPAVMRWPDEIAAGSESDALLHVVDLFPTFAGLAGADASAGLALGWSGCLGDHRRRRGEPARRGRVCGRRDSQGRLEAHRRLRGLLRSRRPTPCCSTTSRTIPTRRRTWLRATRRRWPNCGRAWTTTERSRARGKRPRAFRTTLRRCTGRRKNETFGAAARRAVTQLRRGNPGPTLVRIAASRSRVALVYDETLDADSVPSPDAFTVVVSPGYNSTDVTGVAVSGSEVVLTLASEATAGDTVGLTYEVRDTGAIQDTDDLEAVGVVWVTDEAENDAAFAVTASPRTIAEGESATLTVAVTNGVTFADDQTVTLAVSGTASATDYSGVGAALTLTAGTTSATATLSALDDQEEETDETVTVSASHGGVSIGSATVSIRSVSHDATLSALSLSGIDIGTFSSTTTSYAANVANTVETTTVTATATHAEATVSIDPGAAVSLAEGATEISATVTAEDGTKTQTYTVTVTRADAAATGLPEAMIAADAASATEGAAASFTVTLDVAATEALAVAVSVSEDGSVISGTAPASVTIAAGATSASLTVATDDDSVVEDDGTVTASLSAGTGYTVGSDDSAEVAVADNDTATFAVAANPTEIDEGGNSTVTVSVSNGVTFADDQTIELAVAGTAVATDYTLSGTSPTLSAGAGSVTATVTAVDDTDEEDAETVVVTASRDGTFLGSATVTIAASDEPLLTAQFLDMPETHDGQAAFAFELRFSEEIRISYRTLRDAAFEATGGTVTRARRLVLGSSVRWEITVGPASDEDLVLVLPTTADCEATDAICTSDGRGLSNRLAATVAGPPSAQPEATIEADAASVTEGTAASFTVTLDAAATVAVTVALSVTETGSVVSGAAPTSVTIPQGDTSATATAATDDDSVVEDDGTVTARLSAGTGYTVGSDSSAEVTVADNDTATFAVAANPAGIDEGASSTVTVSVSNGVTFADDQTIELAVSGTAAPGDYTLSGTSPTLSAGSGSVAATLAAVDDTDEEDEETIVVTASLDGASLGSATVTIAASDAPLSDDATLKSLVFSGVDIGTFSSATTSYTATVENDVSSTAATAAANDDGASMVIADANGSTTGTSRSVSLAEGSNAITVTVTAEDGETQKIYRVTVTREAAAETPEGFELHSNNQDGTGLWSDGTLLWVADWVDSKLYAYAVADGTRRSARDIDVGSQPVGLWSDGTLIWVANHGGGVRAYRLSDGTRMANRDIAAADNGSPMGIWSDGDTMWVLDFSGQTAHAYRLSDGGREAASDLVLGNGEIVAAGLWMDATTAWAADWAADRARAFLRSDGAAQSLRDITVTSADAPAGMWSDGSWMWVMNWQGDRVHVVAVPASADATGTNTALGSQPGSAQPLGGAGPPVFMPDPALRAAVAAALGKAPESPVGTGEIAALRALSLRGRGIADLTGLELATNLVRLDLGHNPVSDLWPLTALGRLASLNLDGAARPDLYALASVPSLRALSLRSNCLDTVAPLVYLNGLETLDIGDNAVADLHPLAGLAGLKTLRADRNRIVDLAALGRLAGLRELNLASNGLTDLYALSALAQLQSLDLTDNRVTDLYPLAGLARLRTLRLGRNSVTDVQALSDLTNLEVLSLHGNRVADLYPLAHLDRLSAVDVCGSHLPRDYAPVADPHLHVLAPPAYLPFSP